MDCGETRKLLHAYFDGELDLAHSVEVESHLAACGNCPRVWESLRVLQKGLKINSLYFSAPPHLEERLRGAIDRANPTPKTSQPRAWSWRWAAVAASVAVVVASVVVQQELARRSAQEAFVREAVSAHIRSLMANHLTDVPTSDQHTVKPWFAGKLDFSPPVPDLAPEGFPLVGGRMDYMGGRSVAALVYQRRKHVINVFVWPAGRGRSAPEKPLAWNGYNLRAWNQGEMSFWAVSDLNATELADFTRLFIARTNPPAP